jgi:hypothetical protein
VVAAINRRQSTFSRWKTQPAFAGFFIGFGLVSMGVHGLVSAFALVSMGVHSPHLLSALDPTLIKPTTIGIAPRRLNKENPHSDGFSFTSVSYNTAATSESHLLMKKYLSQ